MGEYVEISSIYSVLKGFIKIKTGNTKFIYECQEGNFCLVAISSGGFANFGCVGCQKKATSLHIIILTQHQQDC